MDSDKYSICNKSENSELTDSGSTISEEENSSEYMEGIACEKMINISSGPSHGGSEISVDQGGFEDFTLWRRGKMKYWVKVLLCLSLPFVLCVLLTVCGYFLFGRNRREYIFPNHQASHDELQVLGWRTDESAGYFLSSLDINSVELSEVHSSDSDNHIHYFSLDNDPTTDLYRVSVRVGDIDCNDLKHVLTDDEHDFSSGRRSGGEAHKYECVGSCWCDEEEITESFQQRKKRRSVSSSLVRMTPYFVAATSSFLAYKFAEDYFSTECESTALLSSSCSKTSTIHSHVDQCNRHVDSRVFTAFCAFVETHDTFSYNIRARDEEQAKSIAIKNTIEKFNPYVEHLGGFEMGFIMIGITVLMGSVFKVEKRFGSSFDRIDCCGICVENRIHSIGKFTFGEKELICCELPMESFEEYSTIDKSKIMVEKNNLWGFDLEKFAGPTLYGQCVEIEKVKSNVRDGMGVKAITCEKKIGKMSLYEKCNLEEYFHQREEEEDVG